MQKSLDQFHKDRSKKDGLCLQCKSCRSKYAQSEKGKAVFKKYQQSEKGIVVRKRYWHTIKGHLQNVYSSMVSRCNKPNNKRFKDYGGRGIKLEFTFNEFYNWCTKNNIDPRGLTIDRINNDGDYSLNNIQFVTAKINSNNRRNKN